MGPRNLKARDHTVQPLRFQLIKGGVVSIQLSIERLQKRKRQWQRKGREMRQGTHMTCNEGRKEDHVFLCLAFLSAEEEEEEGTELIVVAKPNNNWSAVGGGCQTAD